MLVVLLLFTPNPHFPIDQRVPPLPDIPVTMLDVQVSLQPAAHRSWIYNSTQSDTGILHPESRNLSVAIIALLLGQTFLKGFNVAMYDSSLHKRPGKEIQMLHLWNCNVRGIYTFPSVTQPVMLPASSYRRNHKPCINVFWSTFFLCLARVKKNLVYRVEPLKYYTSLICEKFTRCYQCFA